MANHSIIKAFRAYNVDSKWYENTNIADMFIGEFSHKECCGTTRQTIGFIPMESGDLTYGIDGRLAFRVKIETADLKSSVLRDALNKRISSIEKSESRKVGNKEKKDLREQIEFELLPQAFRTSKVITGYFDGNSSPALLFIGTSSMSAAEVVTGLLRKAFSGSLPITPINTDSLVMTLTEWMQGHEPKPFEFTGTIALAGNGEERQKTAAFAKYDGLLADEIRAALEAGSCFKSGELRMHDETDEREVFKFKLSFDGSVSGITYGDAMIDDLSESQPESAYEAFQSEWFIATKSISHLVNQFFKHGIYAWHPARSSGDL